MSDDFFDRLESELVGRARDRARLAAAARGGYRMHLLIRRTAAIVLLAAALAASLSSEFPASANGSAAIQVSLARSL